MIKFHLQFPINAFTEKINYNQKFIFVGSCFAEEIGRLFLEHKLSTCINPHGIQYNPYSIFNSISRCIENKEVEESELFYFNDAWHSWQHHSRFSSSDKHKCVENINRSIHSAHTFLKTADWLFVTLGSAFVYKNIKTDSPIANCHKVPISNFKKHLCSILEIKNLLNKILLDLKCFNPSLKVVFTISPVRYIRDGVVENNVSKSRLIESVHAIVAEQQNCFYFPAYELVIDDLREYRFYKSDLIHPNEQAIGYVFEKLMESSFDENAKVIFNKTKEIRTAFQHRVLNENSESAKKFKQTFLEKCISLKNEIASIDLENEIAFFSN